MEAIGDSHNEQLAISSHAASSSSKELQALHDTAPLIEIAQPLMEKAASGLRGLTKIVGSATPVDEITPDLLAAAAQVKEQIDKEVMLPIMELSEHVKARKREIAVMFNNQMVQLAALKDMLATLKKGEASIQEKSEVVSANAESLAKRSASVLQSANDLLPTITQAEFDYFQELERLQERTKHWQEQQERLALIASMLRDSAENGTNKGTMEIAESQRNNLHDMLKGSDSRMKKYAARLKDAEIRVDELAAAAGWDRDPHGPVAEKQ
jgi:DNA repair exonuclease SbcCD ATPase subunit